MFDRNTSSRKSNQGVVLFQNGVLSARAFHFWVISVFTKIKLFTIKRKKFYEYEISQSISKYSIGALITLVYFCFSLYTLEDYGVTWDEPYHFEAGLSYLRFFMSGNRSYLDGPTLVRPPIANLLSAITHQIFYTKLQIFSSIASYHLAIIILATLAILIIYVFCSEAYDHPTAIAAAICLALFPRFFAHAHMNVKDIPLAAFYLLVLWAFWKGIKTKSWKWKIIAGILFGLALGVKITAIFISLILVLWLLITYRDKVSYDKIKRCLRVPKLLTSLMIYPIITIGTILVVWPVLRPDTIHYLLSFYSGVGKISFNVFYFEKLFPCNDMPWHYSYVLLALTTPLSVLFLAIIGAVTALQDTRSLKNRTSALILLWIGTALLKQNMPGMINSDGIRHFMEAVPAICILAGIGTTRVYHYSSTLIDRLKHYRRIFNRLIAIFVIFMFFLPNLIVMVKIHPYESCYYNELVGGIAGASKNFEIEYYGEVYKQGTIWLNQHAEISAVIAVPRLNEQLVRPYLRSDLKIAGVGEGGIERISNGLNGIVYYRMDEGGGSNVLDSSNNGNDGTIYNASWTTESKEGYALSFDGQDDYVEVPNSASLNTTTAITIVAWVKLNALDNSVERQRQGIVSKYSAEEGKRAYELYFDDTVFTTTQNRFVFAISSTKAPFTGGVIYSDITPSVGQWYCVVGRFKADEFMQIWINGEDHTGGFAYGSLPWGIATNDLNLYISKQYDTQGYFNGVIDEVRIYDRALTACEIQQLYQRGSPEPNYFMFMTRQAFYTQAQYYCLNNLKPSHKIEVDGVPILFIYKLRN